MKNQETIVSDIIQLLSRGPDASGTVILLSGPWGCGKTFIWENNIFPKLEKQRVIYISCFGVSNIDDLNAKLLTKILSSDLPQTLLEKIANKIPRKIKKWLTVSSRLGLEILHRRFGVSLTGLKIDPLGIIPDELIICIDDLERISESLPLDQALGFINFLSEHKKCRILVIANEDHFAKCKERKVIYDNFHEKVVDWRVSVEPDFGAIYQLLIQNVDLDRVRSYLQANGKLILKVFERVSHQNLRTLRRAIESVAYILTHDDIQLDRTPSIRTI